MKNQTTPRTLADCTFTCGYKSSREPTWEKIAGAALAAAIGAGLAVLLVAWWSS